MSGHVGRARCLLIASAISIVAYAASADDPSGPLLALVLVAIGAMVTSPAIGLRVPRVVAGVATAVVLVVTILGVVQLQTLDIHMFGSFVAWMMVVKAFDRRNAGDDAQLLAFSIFLAVASMLLSNGLVVAMLTLVFLPFAAYSAMHLQLRLSHERASRLSRRKVAGAELVPEVRPASGAAAQHALTRTSLVALALGFVFAGVVFVVVPRGAGLRHLGQWGNPGAGRIVSFTSRVNVGTGGSVSTSRTPVLHLRLSTSDGREVGGMGAVQYLRGAVLDHYEDGIWTTSGSPAATGESDSYTAGESASFGWAGGGPTLEQDILLLNTAPEASYLFTIWRPLSIRVHEPAVLSMPDLRRSDHGSVMALGSGGKFRYTVRSAVYDSQFRPRSQREAVGWRSPVVARVAREILEAAELEPDPDRRPIADDGLVISAFRQHFWANYEYSLGEPPPPRGVDPIDWFLTDADRGHCEHYAAALAALCRSVGIPARVVTGYLAVEYNRSTDHYVVRESNAHAWVEAQYEPGLWKTYDATPPTEIMRIHGPKPGLLAGFGRMLDALNYRWVSSVVSFDSASRSDLLSWSEPATGGIGEKAGEVVKHLRVAPPGEIAVLALRLFVVFTALVFGAYGLVRLGKRWVRNRSRRPHALARRIADPEIRGRVRAVPLYQDALALLARAGIRKPEWQPMGAWARSLAARSEELAEVVTELADLFYRMRYGGRMLTEEERDRAEALLSRLPALCDRPRG